MSEPSHAQIMRYQKATRLAAAFEAEMDARLPGTVAPDEYVRAAQTLSLANWQALAEVHAIRRPSAETVQVVHTVLRLRAERKRARRV